MLRISVVLLGASPALAAGPPVIEVRDVIWGFDGTVMRDRFAPLTLVIDNPTNEAFDGELRLFRGDFSGRRVGGFHVETIYLAPATQRVVQFYPLTLSDAEEWGLAWDGGQMTLPKPRYAGPARVLLVDDSDLFDRGGAVKRFPARSFPPFATATDALAEVVLDHAPDWEAPRREALLDWLRQGGTLHLIRGSDGRQPQFTGDLALLNEPSDEFRVGAGLVRRHSVGRAELTTSYVRSRLDPPPRPPDETPEEVERANQYGVGYSYPLEQWRMTNGVFNQLKRMVKADHNWAVIHLLSLSYVAVLFPGCFLIGREFRHVPATFGAIVGSTLLFTGAFYLVGNRGYGESTNVHAVALAEHVGGDRFDVTEWSSVFVIAGGDYAFTHAGEERVYSDATDNEAVNGDVAAGSAGAFVVDVPPYSTRVMAHKSLVRAPGMTMPTAVRDASGTVAFRLPKGFPKDARDVYAIIDRKVIVYRASGGELRPVGQGTRIREFLKVQDADFVSDVGLWGEDEPTPDKRLTQLVRPLMLYTLRLTTDDELKNYYVPDGRAKLFIYAPLTGPFRTLAREADAEDGDPKPEPLPAQTGGVLYSFDLAI